MKPISSIPEPINMGQLKSENDNFDIVTVVLYLVFLSMFALCICGMTYMVYKQHQASKKLMYVNQQISVQSNHYVDENGDTRNGYGHCLECKKKAISNGISDHIINNSSTNHKATTQIEDGFRSLEEQAMSLKERIIELDVSINRIRLDLEELE